MIGDEEECAGLGQIDLHANQAAVMHVRDAYRSANEPTNSVCPGKWCSEIPAQKSMVRSSKVFQLLSMSESALHQFLHGH